MCVCVCRREKRNVRDQANQQDEMMDEEMMLDEWKEEASDAPSASARNGLHQFYYSLLNIDD